MTPFHARLFGAAVALTFAAVGPALAQQLELKLMAPAAPGGGWDQTARAMQQALVDWSAMLDLDALTGASAQPAGERFPRPRLRTEYVPPRTDTESRIAEVWQSYLGIERVGVHDGFGGAVARFDGHGPQSAASAQHDPLLAESLYDAAGDRTDDR